MKKFLYLYIGGPSPDNMTEAEVANEMKAWESYMKNLGAKLVDFGAPLGERKVVGDGAPSKATGYSIVKAADLNAAIAMTKGHPQLAAGGAIEVFDAEPPGM